ncbi:MAG: MoxR family ATPase [bacterium]|nr:MoxR family ATPase [bacterium]
MHTLSSVAQFVDSDFGPDPYFERYLSRGQVSCTNRHIEYMFRIMWPLLSSYRKIIVAQKAFTSYTALAPVAPGDRDGTYIAPGHVLFVDFPGKGKTLLGSIPAVVLGGRFTRFQGAFDNLAPDYLGHRYPDFDANGKKIYKLEEGPAFGDIQLIDEINRNTEKMQGHLLPVLAEGKIILAGQIYQRQPFAIMTMNQIESEGVNPIIEALADRIMFKLRGEWFTAKDFSEIGERSARFGELRGELKQVCDISTIHEIREFVLKQIYVDPDLRQNRMGRFAEISNNPQRFGYLAQYSKHLDGAPILKSGLWGRAFTHWLGAAQALAFFRYRDYVLPEDAKKVLLPIMRHRVVFAPGVVRRLKNVFGYIDQEETIDRILSDLIKEAF